MNITPWRKRNGGLAVENTIEDLWKDALEPYGFARGRWPAVFAESQFPPMNISEAEDHLSVSLELPGMDAKDVQVELMGNQLHVSGERKWEEEKHGKEFSHVESPYGSFSRSVSLPDSMRFDADAIEATFQKGVLEIRVPKVEPTPTAKIPIQVR